MQYERTEMSACAERAMERQREQWNEAVESLESDLENLDDYRRRIEHCERDVLDQIFEAQGYAKKLAESLYALERLAQ